MKSFFRCLPIVLLFVILCSVSFAEDAHLHGEALKNGYNAWNNTELYLESDTTCGMVSVSGNVNLCLNGHILSVEKIALSTGAVLNIYDCSDNSSGIINSSTNYTIAFNGSATLNIYNGTISNTKTQTIRIDKAHSILYMEGGEITASSGDALCMYGDGVVATIRGNSKVSANGSAQSAVNDTWGTLILEDNAQLSGGTKATLYVKVTGTAKLRGGSIVCGTGKAIYTTESKTGETLKSLLTDGYDYYTTLENYTKVTYAENDTAMSYKGTVYIHANPEKYVITIIDTEGNRITQGAVQQGENYILPVNLLDGDGQIWFVQHYIINGVQKVPGDSVSVQESMSLTAVLKKNYTVTIIDQLNNLISEDRVVEGERYTLPSYLQASNGEKFGADYYVVNGEKMQPGFSFVVAEDITLIVSLRIEYTIAILDSENKQIIQEKVIGGDDYILPSTFIDDAGKLYVAESYVVNGELKQPEQSIAVSSSMAIQVKLLMHLHSDNTDFAIPVNQSVAQKELETLKNKTCYLIENVDLTGYTITVSGEVRLCLNGHRLTFDRINLSSNATLYIYDCGENGKLFSSKSQNYNGSIVCGASSTLYLYSGSIQIDSAASNTQAIRLTEDTSTFYMCGGKIVTYGAGDDSLCIVKGTAQISGGSIVAAGKAAYATRNLNGTLILKDGAMLSGGVTATLAWIKENGSVLLAGGSITRGSGKTIDITASGKTVSAILEEGYDYFESNESATPLTYTSTLTVFQMNESISIMPVMSVRFVDVDGSVFAYKKFKKGATTILPAFIQNIAGQSFAVDSFMIEGTKYAPGDEIGIMEQTQITVILFGMHICDGQSYSTPLNTANASLYENKDFTMSGTYYLTSDVDLSNSVVTVSGEVELCLNGYRVIVKQVKMSAGSSFTISDCSANRDGVWETAGSGVPAIDATAQGTTVVIKSGRIIAAGAGISLDRKSSLIMSGGRMVANGLDNACLTISGGSTATLSNCTIDCEEHAQRVVNLGNGTLIINDGAELIGNGRKEAGTSTITESPYVPVHLNDSNAVLIMNGGEISSKLDDAVYVKKARQVMIRGGRIEGGNDGYSEGRSALYIANGSGAQVTISGGTVSNLYTKGNGISCLGNLTVTGSAIIEGTQYALWSKNAANITTNITIQSPDRLVGGVAAVRHDRGTLNISGGVLIGGKYALQVTQKNGDIYEYTKNGNKVQTTIEDISVELSGGRYVCQDSSGSPVFGAQDVNDYLLRDYSKGTLGYYLQASGYDAFDEEGDFLADNKKLNPAISMTAYVRTQDDTPCPHYEWHWQTGTDQLGYSDTLGICDACQQILVKYVGCSMTIATDLSMTFKIQVYTGDSGRLSADNQDNNWAMTFHRDSSTGMEGGELDTTQYDVTVYGVKSGEYLLFTYHGINSQCMTTPISASITYYEQTWRKTAQGDRHAVSDKQLRLPDRTVRDYCVKLYAQGTNANTSRLIANMLQYGAASQVFNNWYMDKLATGGEAASIVSNYLYDYEEPNCETVTQKLIDGYSVGMTLNLGYQTELVCVVGSIPDEAMLYVYAGDTLLKTKTVTAGERVSLAVSPMNYDVLFTIKLITKQGSLAYQRTYGVDAYAKKFWSNQSSASSLIRALYQFGRAAQACVSKRSGELVVYSAEIHNELHMPGFLRIIEESAFENAIALDEVVIGEQVERIESRAFAGSSVKLVRFPQNSSLQYIAPDAFANTSGVQFIVGGSSIARDYLGTNDITEYTVQLSEGLYYNGVITLPDVPF